MTAYRSKTTVAADAIRDKIVSGAVQPGERFDVRSLAAELEMSITPVREALRLLQADGFVQYDEHRAVSAMELSREDAEELYVLRSMIEGYVTERAVRKWTAEDHERLEAIHEEMVAAVGKGDAVAAARANREWHFRIYRAAGTRFIAPVVDRLWNQFEWNAIWRVPDRLTASVAEHSDIQTAIQHGDGRRAAELMVAHITSGADAVRDHGSAASSAVVR